MVWFKIDDKFHASDKRHMCSAAAIGVWATAGSWCGGREKGDGNVPSQMLSSFGGTKRHAAELVRAGLWHAAEHDCDRCPQPADPNGWIFHDWTDQNPSEVQIAAKREAEREKKRRWREARESRRLSTVDNTRDDTGESPGSQSGVTSYPYPRPEPEEELTLREDRNVPARAGRATDPPSCQRHPNGNASGEPCAGCAKVREWDEQQAERQRHAAVQARLDCPDCDENGMQLDPATSLPVRRCTHPRTRARTA